MFETTIHNAYNVHQFLPTPASIPSASNPGLLGLRRIRNQGLTFVALKALAAFLHRSRLLGSFWCAYTVNNENNLVTFRSLVSACLPLDPQNCTNICYFSQFGQNTYKVACIPPLVADRASPSPAVRRAKVFLQEQIRWLTLQACAATLVHALLSYFIPCLGTTSVISAASSVSRWAWKKVLRSNTGTMQHRRRRSSPKGTKDCNDMIENCLQLLCVHPWSNAAGFRHIAPTEGPKAPHCTALLCMQQFSATSPPPVVVLFCG